MQVADSRDGGGEKYFWVARKRFKTFDSQKYLICELKRTGYWIIFTICTVNMLSNKPLNKQMEGDQNVSLTFYFHVGELARNSIWQIVLLILGKYIHSQLTLTSSQFIFVVKNGSEFLYSCHIHLQVNKLRSGSPRSKITFKVTTIHPFNLLNTINAVRQKTNKLNF